MVLVVDIGNTNIVIGLYDGQKWVNTWRVETNKSETFLFYSYKINDFLWEAKIDVNEIEYKVMSSVVPDLKPIFIEVLEKINTNKVVVLDKNNYHLLDVKLSNPNEIGSDLVANATAVNVLYPNQNTIIIDFGTALTFTVVDSAGKVIGVNIAPGLKTAIAALVGNTSQLPEVELIMPKEPIGTNTIEAIQNGVLIGYVGLVKYMIKVIKSHLELDFKVVTTGGLSGVIAPHVGEIDFVEPNLTIYGLAFIGEKIS